MGEIKNSTVDICPSAAWRWYGSIGGVFDTRISQRLMLKSSARLLFVAGFVLSVSGTASAQTPAFVAGDIVMNRSALNVREEADLKAERVGRVPFRSFGIVTSGPKQANNYDWYEIEWTNGLAGWSVSRYLVKKAPPGTALPKVEEPNGEESLTIGEIAPIAISFTQGTQPPIALFLMRSSRVLGALVVATTSSGSYTWEVGKYTTRNGVQTAPAGFRYRIAVAITGIPERVDTSDAYFELRSSNQTINPEAPPCSPASQSVLVNQTASLTASGGSGTGYVWSAPGGSPATGSGVSFSTAYAAVGTKTVTLTDSAALSSTCSVSVGSAPPPPSSPPTSFIFEWIANQSTGKLFPIKVTARNASGGVATGFTGSAQLVIHGSSGVEFCPYSPYAHNLTKQSDSFVGGILNQSIELDWPGPPEIWTTQHVISLTAINGAVQNVSNEFGVGTASKKSCTAPTSPPPPPPPGGAPTLNFSASPSTINPGQSSTLTWSTTNTTSCTASGGGNEWGGTQGKALSGTQSVSPTQTTTYTLTCTGPGGYASKSAKVTVSGTSELPPIPNPSTAKFEISSICAGASCSRGTSFGPNIYLDGEYTMYVSGSLIQKGIVFDFVDANNNITATVPSIPTGYSLDQACPPENSNIGGLCTTAFRLSLGPTPLSVVGTHYVRGRNPDGSVSNKMPIEIGAPGSAGEGKPWIFDTQVNGKSGTYALIGKTYTFDILGTNMRSPGNYKINVLDIGFASNTQNQVLDTIPATFISSGHLQMTWTPKDYGGLTTPVFQVVDPNGVTSFNFSSILPAKSSLIGSTGDDKLQYYVSPKSASAGQTVSFCTNNTPFDSDTVDVFAENGLHIIVKAQQSGNCLNVNMGTLTAVSGGGSENDPYNPLSFQVVPGFYKIWVAMDRGGMWTHSVKAGQQWYAMVR